jgi:uncharacterized DUF497 family protein
VERQIKAPGCEEESYAAQIQPDDNIMISYTVLRHAIKVVSFRRSDS